MKYKITSEPTSHGGDDYFVREAGLSIGDVVTIRSETPDGDGDVVVLGETTGTFRAYVALSCLTPVSEVGAATISVKVTPDLSDFAAVLVSQIADELEKAANALRKAV